MKAGRKKGFKMTDEHKKKISLATLGRTFTDITRKRISDALKGKTPKNLKTLHGKKTLATKKKMSESAKGENCSWWKGGISPEDKLLRKRLEYRMWRADVFERDNYTCRECGEKESELHPHHIKSWIRFPELRYAIENGLTLCKKCHFKKHVKKEFKRDYETSKSFNPDEL